MSHFRLVFPQPAIGAAQDLGRAALVAAILGDGSAGNRPTWFKSSVSEPLFSRVLEQKTVPELFSPHEHAMWEQDYYTLVQNKFSPGLSWTAVEA